MSAITFADVVHHSIGFDRNDPAEALVLRLLDTRWVQRLRDISQTANTRLVYMFSEHSRFGHSLGVAYMAKMLLEKLERTSGVSTGTYKAAVLVAALLHDVGHLAPGSHTAFKTWFPGQADAHESLASKIISEDPDIHSILSDFTPELPKLVVAILEESDNVPPWTWQVISGGGWNVDRGNWCIVDSILAGVDYGKYNIPALIDSLFVENDHLVLNENRLDAMVHFMVSRHALYRQIYQHRVLLASDTLNGAVVARARALQQKLAFKDDCMDQVLGAASVEKLSLETIFRMREAWWRYHLMRWMDESDTILRDLADRLLNRRLLKTVRVRDGDDEQELLNEAERAVRQTGYDPKYYLHRIETADIHAGDSRQSLGVQLDDGRIRALADADPMFSAMAAVSRDAKRVWLALPEEAKELLGRKR